MGFVVRLLGVVPTVVVLGLIGLGGWYGHRCEWKFPKRAALADEAKAPDDWCAEHSVPHSGCVECKAELLTRPPGFGFCSVHGVQDCPLCHPEVAQLDQPPAVTPADLERAKRALELTVRPENSPKCKLHTRRLQFASAEAADKAGVGARSVDPVKTDHVEEAVSAPGEIGYDQTHVAHLSARAPGSVYRVFKRLGDAVKAGDLVALIESAEVGKAKADVRTALGAADSRSQTLANLKTAGVVPDARLREAEAALREARIRLSAARQALVNLGMHLTEADVVGVTDEQLEIRMHFLGVPPEVAATLDPKTTTSNLLPVVAPMDGLVTSRDVVAGEVVDPARMLFEIVDTRRLWCTLELPVEDARRVRPGLPVRFKPDGGKEEAVGLVVWRSTQADPRTRTVKVRADLVDASGRFVANTYGTGRVILRDEPSAVVVPNAAVQSDGNCNVVFVRDRDYLKPGAFKVFHVRAVRLGVRGDANTEIVAGLLPGEVIVTVNADVLRSELLRGNMGDGCGCGH
jgi:cobalt-zinc-cadmium efflux system membrane fusion protein